MTKKNSPPLLKRQNKEPPTHSQPFVWLATQGYAPASQTAVYPPAMVFILLIIRIT